MRQQFTFYHRYLYEIIHELLDCVFIMINVDILDVISVSDHYFSPREFILSYFNFSVFVFCTQ